MQSPPANSQFVIAVVIPALNEEHAIANVINDIPSLFYTVIVVDNGSSDHTADVARSAGALVLHEPRRGYGYACLKGIEFANSKHSDIIVFLDGDYSDYPEELVQLVEPIVNNSADFVIGSRTIGEHERGALLPQARFGNWLSTTLIRLRWGVRFTDLGPFRAITTSALNAMQMEDGTYGWTVEMQIKAAQMKLRCVEIPVRYRKRIGTSKVSGTIAGSVKAGVKILWMIGKYALRVP